MLRRKDFLSRQVKYIFHGYAEITLYPVFETFVPGRGCSVASGMCLQEGRIDKTLAQ